MPWSFGRVVWLLQGIANVWWFSRTLGIFANLVHSARCCWSACHHGRAGPWPCRRVVRRLGLVVQLVRWFLGVLNTFTPCGDSWFGFLCGPLPQCTTSDYRSYIGIVVQLVFWLTWFGWHLCVGCSIPRGSSTPFRLNSV